MEVIELKVRRHCKACEKVVRKALCKIKGVTSVEIDIISNKITVMGYVDRKVVVKAVWKTGRRATAELSKQLTSSSSCRRPLREEPPVHGFRCVIPKWIF